MAVNIDGQLTNNGGQMWIGPTFNPLSLFAASEQGAWYDVSDTSTMFTTSTGTTPVTAVETAVGLILDKSKGAPTPGPQLATTTSASVSGAQNVDLGAPNTIIAGRYYQVSATVSNYTGTGDLGFYGSIFTGIAGVTRLSGNGTMNGIVIANANGTLGVFGRATNSGTFSNVSVRELPGNHAYQSTDASRPILRARYNLLTYSEDLTNAAWSPFQATKNNASQFTADSGGGVGFVWVSQPFTSFGAVSHVFDVEFKYSNKQWVWIEPSSLASKNIRAWFDVQNGVVGSKTVDVTSSSITAVGNGWYRCRVVFTGDAVDLSGVMRLAMSDADNSTNCSRDGIGTVLVRNADFRFGTSIAAYQRIAAATDYATGPQFPQYLAFDGTDDSLLTSSVNFSATDKMTVWAGVTKNSDAAQGVVAELSATIASNNGAFLLTAPNSAAANYNFSSKGTTQVDNTVTSFAAPISNVVTGQGDIAAPSNIIRANGAQAGQVVTTQGTGNYGNYPIYIGRRNNASLPFNGRLYQLVIRGAASTADQINAMETYIDNVVGAY